MVLFNNENIEIYDLDSIKSIINRIASINNTLGKFIYFENGTPNIDELSEDININYENLQPLFVDSADFTTLYNYVNDKLDIDLGNIVYYYITLNKQFDEIEDKELEYTEYKGIFIKPILDNLNETLKGINTETNIDLLSIWNNRYANLINIRENIENNKRKVELEIKVFNSFDIIVGIQYTKFDLEKIRFQLELDINNMSLLEIFNNIKLNKNVPFAVTHYFYKILKDFTPFIEWTNLFDRSKTYFDKYKNIDRDNNIILKILLKSSKINTINDYSEAILNDNKENFNLRLTHNIKKYDISKEDLIDKVLDILDIESYKSEKDIDVNGVFYFPNQKMNKYVLTDLIMNDNLFSSILTVDEHVIGAKSTVFIYFDNPKIGKITAYITQQKVTKNIINLFKDDKDSFPLGSYFLRIKISKSENIKKVEYFQEILSKLFVLYNEKYPEILKFYEDYGMYIELEDEEEEVQKKNALKLIDPNIFRANYTRYCRYPPTFISDEDLDNPEIMYYTKNGKKIKYNVIDFPKEVTQNSVPKKYICKHKKYVYPGLRKNPYDNEDELPYIPCCYPKDQSKIPGSKYRNYYFDEDLVEKVVKQQGIYLSNIILPNDGFGILPENIRKIFYITDMKGNYYRKGVFRNKNSFLNCVMEALDDETNILNIEDEVERENYLNKIRKKLAKESFAAACKQEMYDYKTKDIINYINDEDKYFDPKLFIHLLEIRFKCNIFLFSRNDNGELVLPRHIKGYYKLKNRNKCIFIYEHMGRKSEKNEYPQCELIVRDVGNEIVEYNFPYGNIISENIFNVFNKINTSYIFNQKIELIEFDIFNNPKIIPITQNIDSYGKTRILNISYNNNDISIFTSPLSPYNLKENKINIINKIDINTAIDLAADLNMLISEQVVDENNIIKELRGKIGNISISIPIEGIDTTIYAIPYTQTLNKFNIENNNIQTSILNYSYNYNSILNTFNLYKKLSRYIIEYIIWLYSNYVSNKNINKDDFKNDDVLQDFKNNYLSIDENFKYGQINKTFSLDSGIMNNNKLVIKSEETLKRLFYVLKMYIERNLNEFINFKDRIMIEDFYVDLTDFDSYPFQVILQGEDAIKKWIDEINNKDNILVNEIIHDKNLPYFFRNPLINDNKIYLAQNIDNFTKAQNIAISWYKNRYNPGKDIIIETNRIYNCILYSYKNSQNIKIYGVNGELNDYDIKIIGYKYEGNSFFTVLLDV